MFNSGKVIFEGDTPLDHYEIVDRLYEGRRARVLFSGRAHAAQSGIALDDGPDLLFDYNQRLLELASAVYPTRVLIVGGGAFTLPMALTVALPVALVDVVELDPGLSKIAADYFGFAPSRRLRVINDDGRHYVETNTSVYDMIIIDAFSHLAIPGSLITLQATRAMADRLSENGVLAVNVIATYQGRMATAARSHIATYQAVFEQLDVFPAAHGLSMWLPQNLVFVAQKGKPRQFSEYLRYAPLELLNVNADEAFTDEPNR